MVFSGLIFSALFGLFLLMTTFVIRAWLLRRISVKPPLRILLFAYPILSHIIIYNLVWYLYEYPLLLRMQQFMKTVNATGGCVTYSTLPLIFRPFGISFSVWTLILIISATYVRKQTSTISA